MGAHLAQHRVRGRPARAPHREGHGAGEEVTRAAELAELEADAAFVYQTLQPTPQYAWPLLAARAGCEVVVKHENHQPLGSFKARGGLTYVRELLARKPGVKGIVTATRGNHGQAIPFAARRFGIEA